MKRVLILLAIVFCWCAGQAQDVRANRIIADQALLAPVRDTLAAPNRVGEIRYRVSDGAFYGAISMTAGVKRWDKIIFSGTPLSSSLSSITAATEVNTIDNGGYAQEWQWNALAGTTALTLSTISTAAASDVQRLLNLSMGGANSNAGQETTALLISNAHTGTTSTNYGINVGSGDGETLNVGIKSSASASSGSATNIGGDFIANGLDNSQNIGLRVITANSNNNNIGIQIQMNDPGIALITNGPSMVGIGTSGPTTLLTLGESGVVGATLGMAGSSSGFVTIRPAAAAGTYTLTLPTNDGDANQFLQTNGSGILTWATPSTIATSVPISGLTASTVSNNITNPHSQTWNWNSINVLGGNGYGLSLASTQSNYTSGTDQILFKAKIENTDLTGANGTNGNIVAAEFRGDGGAIASGLTEAVGLRSYGYDAETSIGADFLADGGTTSIAGRFSAATGTTRFAAQFLRGKVGFGTVGTESGVIEIYGVTSGTVTIQPANAAGTYTLTLPTNDGDADQVLTTDGTGNLSWQDAATGGGTPGGADTYVQYNDGGSFGGDAGMVYNETDNELRLNGIADQGAYSLQVNGDVYFDDLVRARNFKQYAAIGTTDFLQVNANNHGSTTDINPGIDVFNDGSNLYGYALTYTNGEYGNSVILPSHAKFTVVTHNSGSYPTNQSSFTQRFKISTSEMTYNGVFAINSSGNITEYGNAAPTNGKIPIGHTANGTLELGNIASADGSITVTNGAGGIDIATTKTLAEGTYTPTLTNTTNITSSTASVIQYQRVGNNVTVYGKVRITATATGAFELRLNLPVASTFTADQHAGGTAFCSGTGVGAAVSAVSGASTIAIKGVATGTTDDTYFFSFTYLIVEP